MNRVYDFKVGDEVYHRNIDGIEKDLIVKEDKEFKGCFWLKNYSYAAVNQCDLFHSEKECLENLIEYYENEIMDAYRSLFYHQEQLRNSLINRDKYKERLKELNV